MSLEISIFDLLRYIYKWKFTIIFVTIVSFIAVDFYVYENQTYTSKVIIKYLDECISDGQTPDGKDYNSNEVKSPNIILNVLDDIGYNTNSMGINNESIDSVRENITVTGVIPTSEQVVKDANEDKGQRYDYYPDTFVIQYEGNDSKKKAIQILNSVVRNYFSFYAETYINFVSLNEVDYTMGDKSFDYIEQLDSIQDNVDYTIDLLDRHSDSSYRSPTTGLSFGDIKKEFEELNEFAIPALYTKIYEGQVTLDKSLLIDKYTKKKEQHILDSQNHSYKADMTKDKMDAYIEANKDVPNSYNSADRFWTNDDGVAIIQDVQENYRKRVKEQTTYDTLIKNYVDDKIAANNSQLSADHCDTVLARFTGSRRSDIDYEQYESDVKEGISDLLSNLEELYAVTNNLVRDYNAYIPSQHLKKVSDVIAYEAINSRMYRLIAIGAGFAASSLFAIVCEIMIQHMRDTRAKTGETAETPAAAEKAKEGAAEDGSASDKEGEPGAADPPEEDKPEGEEAGKSRQKEPSPVV